jgi:hypothetical protein
METVVDAHDAALDRQGFVQESLPTQLFAHDSPCQQLVKRLEARAAKLLRFGRVSSPAHTSVTGYRPGGWR